MNLGHPSTINGGVGQIRGEAPILFRVHLGYGIERIRLSGNFGCRTKKLSPMNHQVFACLPPPGVNAKPYAQQKTRQLLSAVAPLREEPKTMRTRTLPIIFSVRAGMFASRRVNAAASLSCSDRRERRPGGTGCNDGRAAQRHPSPNTRNRQRHSGNVPQNAQLS